MSNITDVISAITTEPRKAWPQYQLETRGLLNQDGSKTKFQAIFRKGRIVTVVSKGYKLLPNEEVIKAADEVAARIGASPANMDQANRWFKSQGHVTYSPDGYRLAAYYTFNDPVDVTGGGDIVEKGFGVVHGIDGGTALRIFPTDIRTKCNNIMMHLYSGLKLAEGDVEHIVLDRQNPIIDAGMKNLIDAQNEWSKLNPHIENPASKLKSRAFYSMRHSKGLEIDVIEEAGLAMKKIADKVAQRYKEMVQLKLSVAKAEKLVAALPQRLIQQLDFIKVVDKEIKVADKTSEWKAFNDVTEILTFGKATFRSTLDQFRKVDQILVAA